MRTLEQLIEFDSGLTIGRHLVEFRLFDKSRRAIVEITPRGCVNYLKEPTSRDMYNSWARIKGNKETSFGGVKVWGSRDPQYMTMFEGVPVVSIDVETIREQSQ